MFFLLSFIYIGAIPHFKYKVITASVPGQPGTIEYIEITVGEKIVRFDHGPDLTRLFNKEDGSEIYLDHRHKTWRKIQAEEDRPTNIHFQIQKENVTHCDGQVYKSNVIDSDFGLYLVIEFIPGEHEGELMGHLLDLQNLSTFDQDPSGSLPCHIQVMAAEPVITIMLVEQSTRESNQDLFEVPANFEAFNP